MFPSVDKRNIPTAFSSLGPANFMSTAGVRVKWSEAAARQGTDPERCPRAIEVIRHGELGWMVADTFAGEGSANSPVRRGGFRHRRALGHQPPAGWAP